MMIDGAPNWNEILDLGENDATQIEVDDLAKSLSILKIWRRLYTRPNNRKAERCPANASIIWFLT
jgi:hypothetical protein